MRCSRAAQMHLAGHVFETPGLDNCFKYLCEKIYFFAKKFLCHPSFLVSVKKKLHVNSKMSFYAKMKKNSNAFLHQRSIFDQCFFVQTFFFGKKLVSKISFDLNRKQHFFPLKISPMGSPMNDVMQFWTLFLHRHALYF